MRYADFMQRYRPLYAPDGVDGGAGADTGGTPAASVAAAPAAEAAPVVCAAPAAGAEAGMAVAPDGAPAEVKTDSAATLLEAATGKPKPDAAAAEGADGKKDEPAPADAAKTDAEKTAAEKGDAKPKTEAELKAEAEAAKTDPDAKDATAEAQPPAPIKYEAFKLPDGLKLDDKELAKFSEFAGAAQIPQDVAQGLVDMYVAERQNDVVQARADQRKVWDTLNDTWKTDLRNDPQLGGNRLETTLSLAKAVVEEFLPANEQAEYMAHMRNNGMGNFKLHVKLLHNIGKAMNVFEDGIVPANPQAPKAQKGPGQRGWYDKSLNAPQ
jgi:hypothetical protein